MGQILPRASIGPRRVYWPTVSSMNSNGRPHNINIIMYGIRNAPPPDL